MDNINTGKVAFCTLGCKVNQYETEAMKELFMACGYEIVNFTEFADIYVVNTCTVTSISDRKSRQMFRRARNINPQSVVVVTGCYAQTAADTVLAIEEVNVAIGTSRRTQIVSITQSANHNSKINAVADIMAVHDFENLVVGDYMGGDKTRAYLKIQDGCNQYCSYCIIPYARGNIRSRKSEDILSEVARLIQNGFKEIIFAGIHVASYGVDLGNTSLAKIVNEVNNVEGIERIRLSSIEPMTLNAEFIKEISGADKLCNHFHISLQSGSHATLERMNRKYSPNEFYSIVQAIRANFPDAAISTDIMVGFVGETDEEFVESYEFAKKVKFSSMHVFKYSVRAGTAAANMRPLVDERVKEARSQSMIALAKEMEDEFLQKFVGNSMPVLFETRHGNSVLGKTTNYLEVSVEIDEDITGQIKDVRILSAQNGKLMGRLS